MVKILLHDISHSYDNGKTWAVKNINLEFESGKRYSILGPSGAGKTTILKIICGLIKPSKGKIYFNNNDVTDYPPEKRNVAIVFQFPVVYRMTVLENLLFPMINLKISKNEKIKKASSVAELLGIDHLLKQQAHKLGPADRQLVAIGRALVRDTDIMLLDEPTSSIEPEKKYQVNKILFDISDRFKKTMIFVTHEQTEALTFGDKIAIISQTGELVQFGTFDEIYRKSQHEFVGFFIGFPGMNLINALVNDQNTLNIGNFKIKLDKINISSMVGTVIKVGIRPEDIIISTTYKENSMSFIVKYIEDLGRNRYILHLQSGNVSIKALHDHELPVNSTVWIHFPEERLHFFDKSGWRLL